MAFVDAAKGCANGALGCVGESSTFEARPGLDGGDESTGPKMGDDDGVTLRDETGDGGTCVG